MSKIEEALAKAAAERKRSTRPDKRARHKKEDIHSRPKELTPDMLVGMDARLIALFGGGGGATAAAEQYKHLRTKILRAKKLYSHNTVLVTSALPGEGKTTTAAGLAITVAQGLQETVLLVDADLRKPSIHKTLGIDPEHLGLADYLAGTAVYDDVVVKTNFPKLSVIPSGLIPSNPSELISSERMASLITEVKTRYDDRLVIIDSPPVLSLTDSVVLGQKVDAVLLVVFAGRTHKDAALEAIHTLNEVNLMGIVFNHFDALPLYYGKYKMRKYGYGYSYGYGYGYGYGYDDQKTRE